MKTKAIVTGGAGFIGSNLVDELIAQDFDVHVIDNLENGSKENINDQAVFHKVDIRDREAILPLFEDATYVFHTAALPRVQVSINEPVRTHEANVTGTLNVLIASAQHGVSKFVFSSSSSIYGDQDKMPLHEEMEARPKSPYGLHKLMGEQYAKMWSEIYELPTVNLRYFNVYGPRQNPEGAYALVIAKFLRQIKNGEAMTITGDGEQTRDFTHVSDVVRANILAATTDKHNSGDVFNIGAGNNTSINRVAELIGGEKAYIEARYEPRDTLADNSKAKKILGWEPQVTIEAGIEDLRKNLEN